MSVFVILFSSEKQCYFLFGMESSDENSIHQNSTKYKKSFRARSSPFKEKEMSVIWFATWLRFVRELEILGIQRKLFL